MKRGVLLGFILLGTFISTVGFGQVQEDVRKYPSCKYCGMDREQFAHSRVYIEYEDGTTVGTCSIHCAALDLALNIDKMVRTIKVGELQLKIPD